MSLDAVLALPQGVLGKLVDKGPLVLVEETRKGEVRTATAAVLIEAPREEVWEVITDYGGLSDLFPDMERSTVLEAKGDRANVELRFKVGYGILGVRFGYTLQFRKTPDRFAIDFKMVEGDVKDAYGAWRLLPAGGGKSTIGIYNVYMDVSSMGRIVGLLLRGRPSAEMMINAAGSVMVVRAVKSRCEGEA